jgi:Tol biopolymer transport system component/predicted Ser/Thr protein kinase
MPDRIGPYEVSKELGRGGMGVVYLATDTRLNRRVAIKALPPELASDPARLERFEREARMLAQLNHPNLAGIHGVEEQDGARYLVLEFVEGESLAEVIDRGPLAVDDAIDLSAQIAAGVEAAHEMGVVHRDLKPANIMITPEGQAKVLDFGLARTDENGQSSTGALDSPTITTPQPQHSPTIAGAILGTAAYMSPEQARGRRVDKRTDIWSFGVVLYEMLAGASPFHGETATDSIGAVLHKDLDLERLPRNLPRDARRLITRCLQRDKSMRLQSIADARVELTEIAHALGSGVVDETGIGSSTRSSNTPWLVCAAIALVAVSLGAVLLMRPAPTPTIQRAVEPRIDAVDRLTDFEGIEGHPTISPDGRSVAYVANDEGDTDIFLLRVGGSNPINLTADSPYNDYGPAFSPDGEQIAFSSTRGSGGVYVMGATGEDPRRVAPEGFDPAWSPDGKMLAVCTAPANDPFGRPSFGEIFLVDVDSRQVIPLSATKDDVPSLQLPHDAVAPNWSPDGTRIVYWSTEGGQRDLYWMNSEGGTRHRIINDAATDWDPIWAPDGQSVIFLSDRGGTLGLWRLPLTPEGEYAGEPTPMMPGPVQIEEFAMMPDGSRFVVGTREDRGRLGRVTFDAETLTFGDDAETLYSSASALSDLDVSDNGRWFTHRIAGDAGDDIVVADLDGTTRRTLMRDQFRDRGSRFMNPDGSKLSFFSNRTGDYTIWTMQRFGIDQQLLIEADDTGLGTPVWKRDMSALATHRMRPLGTRIYSFDENGVLMNEPPLEFDTFVNPVVWSHDGSRLLGFSELQEGLLKRAVLVPETGEITFVLTTDTLGVDATPEFLRLTWIDSTRLIGWENESNRVTIIDTVTGESQLVDAPFPEPAAFFKRVDDTLYYVRNSSDGDLWLVETDSLDAPPVP